MLEVLECFAGLGACSKALTNLGIKHHIADAVEIDKYAVKSFNAIHGTNFEPQDIKEWDKDVEVDLIMHGSPCQDFSLAGLGKGGDEGSGTRSSLMYETLRIVEKLKPKYVIWENVKGVLSQKHRHNFDAYQDRMAELGYQNYYQVLNAKDYGVPQNRERVFTVSIRNDLGQDFHFPEPQPLEKRLKDVLETQVGEKYYLSDEQVAKFKARNDLMVQRGNGFRYGPEGDICSTLAARDYKGPKCVQTNEPKIVDDIYKNRDPRVYDKAPTLRAYHAGDLKVVEPFIAASRGRNPENPSDRTVEAPTEQRLEPNAQGLPNTLTSVQKDDYVCEPTIPIKTANTKGYDEATVGDSVDLGYPNSTTRRGRVGHGVSHTLDTHDGEAVVSPDFRIRKLTPLECWRLMGFDDEDFYKAEKVNSNTQLYKQAGNSIVVNVLEAILAELLPSE